MTFIGVHRYTSGRIIVWTANPLQLPLYAITKCGLCCEAPLLWSVSAVTACYRYTPLKHMEVYVLSRTSDSLKAPTVKNGRDTIVECHHSFSSVLIDFLNTFVVGVILRKSVHRCTPIDGFRLTTISRTFSAMGRELLWNSFWSISSRLWWTSVIPLSPSCGWKRCDESQPLSISPW
jgi:hypothetical protein